MGRRFEDSCRNLVGVLFPRLFELHISSQTQGGRVHTPQICLPVYLADILLE